MPTIVNLKKALAVKTLPKTTINQSIEIANKDKKRYTCNHAHLKEALLSVMERYCDLIKGTNIIN